MMNRRTQFKLRRLNTILKRDIFNSRYIVRNTLVLMILVSVFGIIAVSAGSMTERRESQVEAETFSDSYAVQANDASAINQGSITALKSELVEPDSDKAAVDVQSVAMTGDVNTVYDFVTNADSLNIRAEADADSEIVGRLMLDAVGTVQEEAGEWTRISSGGITGYVKTEYILTKDAAADRLEDCIKHIASVTASEVRIRENASTDSNIIILAKSGDTFVVDMSYNDGSWSRIRLADGTYGYISSEYISIQAAYEEAISIDTINALKAARESAAKQQSEDEKKQNDKKNTDKDKDSDKTSDKKDNADKTTEAAAGSDKKNNGNSSDKNDTQNQKPSNNTSSGTSASDNQVTVGTTSRGSFGLSDEDIKLLACIVYAESGGESYEGQLAVANVVLNRLQSGKWGSTVSDVIYAPGQFTAVNSSSFENALSGSPSGTSLSAAKAAAGGTNNIGSFMSFRPVRNANTDSYSSYTIIGNHCFF